LTRHARPPRDGGVQRGDAAYVAYIKDYITPAIEAGVTQIFLEEPEYWVIEVIRGRTRGRTLNWAESALNYTPSP
jgi:hypothetical protein